MPCPFDSDMIFQVVAHLIFSSVLVITTSVHGKDEKSKVKKSQQSKVKSTNGSKVKSTNGSKVKSTNEKVGSKVGSAVEKVKSKVKSTNEKVGSKVGSAVDKDKSKAKSTVDKEQEKGKDKEKKEKDSKNSKVKEGDKGGDDKGKAKPKHKKIKMKLKRAKMLKDYLDFPYAEWMKFWREFNRVKTLQQMMYKGRGFWPKLRGQVEELHPDDPDNETTVRMTYIQWRAKEPVVNKKPSVSRSKPSAQAPPKNNKNNRAKNSNPASKHPDHKNITALRNKPSAAAPSKNISVHKKPSVNVPKGGPASKPAATDPRSIPAARNKPSAAAPSKNISVYKKPIAPKTAPSKGKSKGK